jgi:acetyltransferase-like isoleucine patch superfamily enzyme
MRTAYNTLAEYLARARVMKLATCDIAQSAKVTFRGMKRSPPSRLHVGEFSIFEGSIMSDRDGSAVVIGDNTFVGGSAFICAERIDVGNDVLISWGCTIVDHNSHATDWRYRKTDVRDWYEGKKDWRSVKVSPVRICDKSWIGFNAIILPGVTVGEGAVVGCGSVVTKDVPPYCVAAGNPARVIRAVDHDV